MKKFLLRLIIFLLPLLLYEAVFIMYEPYNYFGVQKAAFEQSTALDKLRGCRREKYDYFLFGDSRSAYLNMDYVEKLTGHVYLNTAFGGASLEERMDLFDYMMAHQKRIKKVIFQIDWWTFNKNYSLDRVKDLEEIAGNPFAFIFNLEYNKATVRRFKKLMKDPAAEAISYAVPSGVDKQTRQQHFEEYIQTLLPGTQKFQLDREALSRLCGIARHCRDNGIELLFVAPPSHDSTWKQLVEPYKILQAMEVYKSVLSQYAPVYDFEFPSEYSNQDDQYRDGFHLEGMSPLQRHYDDHFRAYFPILAEYMDVIFSEVGVQGNPNVRLWRDGAIVSAG